MPLAILTLLALAPWQPLFDGHSLAGWRATSYARHGKVTVEDGAILLHAGDPLTGVTWTKPFPKSGYELRFEATRKLGGDFFASLTFPVENSHGTWVTGGWGGDIVGLSSIDGWDAADNETRSYFTFEPGKWYTFRLVVQPPYLRAWIGEQQVFNVNYEGRSIALRPGAIELSAPLGFSSYYTTGAIRKVEYRMLSAPPSR